MIRQAFILLTILISAVQVFAQNCLETRAFAYLNGNDARVLFRNGGDMFWDGGGTAQFIVPDVDLATGAPEISTLFAGALWLGGYDNGDNLVLAAQTYRASGNDYWAGPLEATTGSPINNACTNFDQIWSIERWAIEIHKQDFNDNGQIDNPIDPTLLRWPAKGNAHFMAQMGFSLPNQELAPFYDQNNNGLYEPTLGDFPVFEQGDSSAVAEQMLWYVFNDNGNIHSQSNGQPLKVEVQITAYSFACKEDSLLNRTIFVKNKIINRNNSFIRDFKAGIWTDPDLGCPNDDYVGTIPSMNTVYAYNADAVDDNPCGAVGGNGYGNNPPVQAITILNHSLHNTMYHGNGGASAQADPQSTIGYYHLLNGRWLDSTALTVGGDGYNSGSTNVTNYVFPDHPLDPSGWSAYAESLGPLDRRIIATVAKDTLYPSEAFEIDVAYSYHRNNDSSHVQNVNLMYQQVPLVQQFYDNNYNMTGCTRKKFCVANCVYPGDMNNNGIANSFDKLDCAVAIGQNLTAAARTDQGTTWRPHDLPTPAINAYLDANGDGSIDLTDLGVGGSVHSLYTGAPEGFNTIGNDLFFERDTSNSSFSVTKDSILNIPKNFFDYNQRVLLWDNLGDTNLQTYTIYGLTYEIEYDPNVLELADHTSPNFNVQTSWINGYKYAYTEPEQGNITVLDTRTDGNNVTGGGAFNRWEFRLKSTAPVNKILMSTDVCFKDFKAIDSLGNVIPIGAQCYTVYYQDTNAVITSIPNEPKLQTKDYQLSINPNPVSTEGQLAIRLLTTSTVKVQLLDIAGKQVVETQIFNLLGGKHNLPLNAAKLANGIYFCRVWVDEEPQTIKFIKFE